MTQKFSNFARGTLVQAAGAADTEIFIDATEATLLPTLGVSDFCKIVLFDGVQDPEIIEVTDNDTGDLTVTRAQESTVAYDWAAGTRWELAPTAEQFQSLISAAGSAGRIVGTTTNLSNAYTLTIDPADTMPLGIDGEEAYIEIPANNTGAATLTITNGTDTDGPTPIVGISGAALVADDMESGFAAILRYDLSIASWRVVTRNGYNANSKTLNGGGLGPFRSGVFNGNFATWGASSYSTPASASETATGWNPVYDGSIGTFTISRQSFTPGQTAVPGEPQYFARWDQSAAGSGSSFRYFQQTLKGGLRNYANKTRTHTIYLKADTTRSVTVAALQYFGTGGSPSANVLMGSGVLSLTTSWQKFTLTVANPSVSGKTFGSGNDDGIIFRLALPLNTTMTIDFAMAKEEQGSFSTAFDDFTFPINGANINNIPVANIVGLGTIATQNANAVTITGGTAILTGGTLSGFDITVNADPVVALGVATKQYVDNVAAGLDIKPSCQVATTANITLSGAQTIDGISVIAGDRVLVKNQSTASQNGIYLCASGSWTRALDADAWAELPGALTLIEVGSTNADTCWVCTVDAGGTIGVTSVAFSQFFGTGLFQPHTTNLDTYSGITPSSNVQSVLGAANYAAINTLLGLGTAALKATGTSGSTVPLLDGTNTWANAQTMSSALQVNSTISATGTITGGSDRKFKKRIKDLSLKESKAFVRALRPRKFTKDGHEMLGFVAQEIKDKRFVSKQGLKIDPYLAIPAGSEWIAPVVRVLQHLLKDKK